jgi:alpha-D-xyloside xylohydrolase
VEAILTQWIKLRHQLKPYIFEQLTETSRTGLPLVRPLWVDHQGDPACLMVANQYRFGDTYMVAPVSEMGARSRSVYLPAGHTWYDAWTGEKLDGGQTIDAKAPLDRMPVYSCEAGAVLTID